MKTMDEWVDELKARDLPVLRRTIMELGRLAVRMEQVKAAEIVNVVLQDPLMTLKVLRLVNGMSRSRLSNEITTVEHALMMLGIGPFFHHHSNLSAVEENLQSFEDALPELMRVVSRAHHAAWQARDWAIFRADMKSEEVYIGALLYDMGEILLWALAPEQALQIRKRALHKKISTEEAQQDVLGFGVRDLQFALTTAWRLPELVQTFMHSENACQPRMLGVIMAASVARHAEKGWLGTQLLADYEVIAKMLHTSFDEAVAMVHHNSVAAARQWERYGVPPAAAWLPMLPGEWPEDPVDQESGQAEEAICLMPRADVLQKIMEEISAHLDGSLNLHDMMSLVLKGMHEGIGLNRVVFALMTADRTAIKSKYIIGADPESPLRQFQIDLTQPQLFKRLMEKVQSVWFSASNQKALEPMIPPGVWRLIGHGEFFAMSVFVHDKPVGLFYADRNRGECVLDEHSYQEFKKLCLRASQGLAHLAKK
ncbi:MAG: HDOD domain-containing protein [Sulfuricella sp.]|nr:HDOD domain-containing protein [Gammaproteobacteria bacterium]